MAKLNLILADYDTRYLQGITNFISNNYPDKFNITCFTDIKILLETLKNSKKKDILLINKGMFISKIIDLGIKSVLILGEGKEVGGDYIYPTINKYQTGASLYQEIIKAYTEQNPQNVEKITCKYDNTNLVTLYSPVGGSGKSIYAASLAMVLRERGDEVLYINFEDVQSTEVYFTSNKETGFSDLIYYVKERSDNFSSKFVEIADKDARTGVTFLKNTENILDIEDMDKDDMKWMLERLIELNMFSYIIVDTTSKYNSIYNMLINSSTHIICPLLKEKTAIEKMKTYVNSMTDLDRYFLFYNKSRMDIVIDTPNEIKEYGNDITLNIVTDFNLYLNEGSSVLDSQIIMNGVKNIVNILRL